MRRQLQYCWPGRTEPTDLGLEHEMQKMLFILGNGKCVRQLPHGVNNMRSWLIKLHNILDMSAQKSQKR